MGAASNTGTVVPGHGPSMGPTDAQLSYYLGCVSWRSQFDRHRAALAVQGSWAAT